VKTLGFLLPNNVSSDLCMLHHPRLFRFSPWSHSYQWYLYEI